jgi:assimilatory nitrate reductase catalytic subunit
VDSVDTHCPYCALQCAMTLTPTAADTTGTTGVTRAATGTATGTAGTAAAPGSAPGRPADVLPLPVSIAGRAFPTNRGGLCKKGWTAAELLGSADRIREPMLRHTDGSFAPVSWVDALDLVAEKLRAGRSEYGADSVGVFGGGGLTNEKAYQLGKFTRLALGSSRIDYNGRFCMSSAAAAGNRAFGLDRGLPFRVEDLDAADTILLLGSNVAQTMPPFIGHLDGARRSGGLIVVDPRRTATARLTEDGAGMHVQPAPGTDLVLLLGLIHLVLAERLADTDYLQRRTTGFDQLRFSVAGWYPQRVQEHTGVPVWQLQGLARRLAAGRGTYILTGRGVEQHVDGTDTATAAINLALVLGLVGTEHSGYGTLTGQGNGQGGREHGQKCDQLPGYRKITDPAARAHVAGVWGVDPLVIPGAGLPAVELLNALGEPGGIRTLLVHGANVVVSAPDADRVRAALASLDFLVVSDFFFSETAALADVVLPVTQWAEEDGTMTSLEGRVLRRRRAIDPPDGVRSELWILSELARRLAAPGVYSTDPGAVFDELCRASAGGTADYSGLDYALLDTGEPAYWPYPAGSAGTPRLFLDGFAHDDGRARLIAVTARAIAAPAQTGGALTLITGRLLEHYQSGSQTRRVPELAAAQPEARLQVHPATAVGLGLADGGWAELTSERGVVRCRTTFSADIRPDTVFLPFHFPADQRANLLTAGATDPVSGMPEFKRTAVRVRAIDAPGRPTVDRERTLADA